MDCALVPDEARTPRDLLRVRARLHVAAMRELRELEAMPLRRHADADALIRAARSRAVSRTGDQMSLRVGLASTTPALTR